MGVLLERDGGQGIPCTQEWQENTTFKWSHCVNTSLLSKLTNIISQKQTNNYFRLSLMKLFPTVNLTNHFWKWMFRTQFDYDLLKTNFLTGGNEKTFVLQEISLKLSQEMFKTRHIKECKTELSIKVRQPVH